MKLSVRIIQEAIRVYRKTQIFPMHTCVHRPTCSVYTERMVERYGLLKGLRLGFLRILSCRADREHR